MGVDDSLERILEDALGIEQGDQLVGRILLACAVKAFTPPIRDWGRIRSRMQPFRLTKSPTPII